jgi:hypothetical protein
MWVTCNILLHTAAAAATAPVAAATATATDEAGLMFDPRP